MYLQVFLLLKLFLSPIKKNCTYCSQTYIAYKRIGQNCSFFQRRLSKLMRKKLIASYGMEMINLLFGAKVSWELVCVPRKNGGLGLNKAVVMK